MDTPAVPKNSSVQMEYIYIIIGIIAVATIVIMAIGSQQSLDQILANRDCYALANRPGFGMISPDQAEKLDKLGEYCGLHPFIGLDDLSSIEKIDDSKTEYWDNGNKKTEYWDDVNSTTIYREYREDETGKIPRSCNSNTLFITFFYLFII